MHTALHNSEQSPNSRATTGSGFRMFRSLFARAREIGAGSAVRPFRVRATTPQTTAYRLLRLASRGAARACSRGDQERRRPVVRWVEGRVVRLGARDAPLHGHRHHGPGG